MAVMNDKEKYIEIESRKFVAKKFPAKTAIKMSKTILAKALPAFSGFSESVNQSADGDNEILFKNISEVFDKLSDEDLDKVVDTSLMFCGEILPAGQAAVLNKDGTFGVVGVEDDMILTLRLVAEVLLFNYADFFDENRWGSMFKSLAGMLPSKA